MHAIVKYPRTPHLEGSRLQPGDEDDGLRLADLPEGDWVWEEKLDGANTGISFSEDGQIILQSRGHALQGGAGERQFDMLKAWGGVHEAYLRETLGDRYVAYFEWMAAKHTIFYDALAHLAFEEDVFDKIEQRFLTTQERQDLFAGGPVQQVPILRRGEIRKLKQVKSLVGRSLYQTPEWRDVLEERAVRAGVDPTLALVQTDGADLAEGLYLKIERPGEGVVGRYKWVRAGFVQSILESGSHWNARPLLENVLAPGVDIYASPTLPTPTPQA